MKPIISLYAGHDSAITIYHPERDKFYHLNLDRFFGAKHFHGFGHWEPNHPHPKWRFYNQRLNSKERLNIWPEDAWADIHQTIKELWDIDNDYSWFVHKHRENKRKPDIWDWMLSHPCRIRFENDYYCGNYRHQKLQHIVPNVPNFKMTHHDAHCISGFVQSDFKKAVCFSLDGGGDDTQCQYVVIDENLKITKKETWREINVGVCYTFISMLCETFRHTTQFIIDGPGKMMGLSAYSLKTPYIDELADDMLTNYFNFDMSRKDHRYHIEKYNGLNSDYNYDRIFHKLREVKHGLCAEFKNKYAKKPLEGKKELDVVLAAQTAIEKFYYHMVRDVLMPDIIANDNNLVLSGGCALNVLAVRMLQREFPEINIYVPRDPGDDGLSIGMLIGMMSDHMKWNGRDIELETPKILDYDRVPYLVEKYNAVETSIEEMTRLLKDGNIMGLIQGPVERGPRALGFRSIICDPSYPDQKERINAKVKRREGYRPFAPACREEDAEKYFSVEKLDRILHTMSTVVTVKEDARASLSAITHLDGSARLQTVTPESNPFFYDLLTEFDGVLLNTSFNLQGKPILNKAEDGLSMLYNTNLDYVIIEHDGKLWKFQ